MLARSPDAEAGPRRPRLRSRRFRGNTEAGGRGPVEAGRMSGALRHAGNDTGASGSVAPDLPMFDLRARAIETVVVVASVVVLRVLGVLLPVISSYGLGSTDALFLLLAMVADPNLLVWIALVAAVQFGLRSMRRPGRWALIVLAAPVAVFVATDVRSLPGLEIHLMNVQREVTGYVSRFVSKEAVDDYHRELGEKGIERARRMLDAAGVKYQVKLSVGTPWDEITRHAASKIGRAHV